MHLWVEGFFEVFATVVIAFLFARLRPGRAHGRRQRRRALGDASSSPAASSARSTTSTSRGTPTVVLALGVGVQRARGRAAGLRRLRGLGEPAAHRRRRRGCGSYRWPIYFFVAVAFWNLVGAGLFGFMINPPIALYYMQGLNTTPVHGHAALFGVYGMLGIGLMLFCLRALRPDAGVDGAARSTFAFWAINVGLLRDGRCSACCRSA